MKLEFVFTSHPTMIYLPNGKIRGQKLTVSKEFNEVDNYINSVNKYLRRKNINFINISSWCGGDRDGHTGITPQFTYDIMKKIDYNLDIRDNSKKIEQILKKNINTDLEEFINKMVFSNLNQINDLYETISIMKDGQNFIISDCEKFYHIYFIYKLSSFLNKKIKIIPLFENSSSLENSISIIEECIVKGIYKEKEIEIMLAYSDTNKRCGIFDSCFQLYFTQIKLHQLAKKYDKEIVFFHGVGGSPPRGGSSFEQFLFRLPNESLKKIRITIQGEKIFQYFGDNKKTKKTVFNFFTSYQKRLNYSDKMNYNESFLLKINRLSIKSRLEYSQFVDEGIIIFFINNTYQNYLSDLNSGSRPSKRYYGENIKIEDIRAITWVFGWSSIDFLLPSWLGYNEEIRNFLMNNRFLPWEYILEDVKKAIDNTKIHNRINQKLINKYIKISQIFYHTNKNKKEIIKDIIKKRYLG